MGKRARKGSSRHLTATRNEPEPPNEHAYLDPSDRDFIYDAVDDFHNDTDDGANVCKMIDQDPKTEQVLGLGNYSSDEESSTGLKSDEEFFMSDSDLVDEGKEVSEDERDWGRKKRFYYGTDLTDERLYNETISKGKDKGERLRLEMESVGRFQGRMSEEVGDLTFNIRPEPKKMEEVKSRKPKVQKMDRKMEKLYLVDLKTKTSEVQLILEPLIGLLKKGVLPESLFTNYLEVKYQLTLNYICALSAFMMIKSSGEEVEHHPVNSRLSQYRRLLKELEVCDEKFTPQLQEYLKMVESGKLNIEKRSNRFYTNTHNKNANKSPQQTVDKSEIGTETVCEKTQMTNDNEDISSENESIANGYAEEDVDASGHRRLITSEMKKNKGLIPSRRKDLKNPRVKYRMKYKNKLKKRKGQVREVRRELDRYQGEASGIKANLVKSIKLK